MIGQRTRITWEPDPADDPPYSTGFVRHAVRGTDGSLTYAVDVDNTTIYVHSSRVIHQTDDDCEA